MSKNFSIIIQGCLADEHHQNVPRANHPSFPLPALIILSSYKNLHANTGMRKRYFKGRYEFGLTPHLPHSLDLYGSSSHTTVICTVEVPRRWLMLMRHFTRHSLTISVPNNLYSVIPIIWNWANRLSGFLNQRRQLYHRYDCTWFLDSHVNCVWFVGSLPNLICSNHFMSVSSALVILPHPHLLLEKPTRGNNLYCVRYH